MEENRVPVVFEIPLRLGWYKREVIEFILSFDPAVTEWINTLGLRVDVKNIDQAHCGAFYGHTKSHKVEELIRQLNSKKIIHKLRAMYKSNHKTNELT